MEHPTEPWPQLVAHALHDGPMQTVVSIGLELDSMSRLVGTDRAPSDDQMRLELQRLRGAALQAAAELRAIVRQLSDESEEDGETTGVWAHGYDPAHASNGHGDPTTELGVMKTLEVER